MKIITRTLGAILVFLISLGGVNYYSFYNKKTQLTSGFLAVSIQSSFKEFVLRENKADLSVDSFLHFFEENHPVEFEEVTLQKWNLGILVFSDTIKIYEFGFDEEDDKNPVSINLKDFSYWNYIKGGSMDFLISSTPIQKTNKEVKEDVFEAEMDDDLKRFKIVSDSMDKYDAEHSSH